MNRLNSFGRVIFALPFAIFGLNHFIMYDFYLGMVTSFIPLGGYLVILTGILLIGCSIAIITRKFIQIATISLAILLFLFIISIHIPNLVNGSNSVIAMISLLKDTSLMGGSLFMAGILNKENSNYKEH